MVKWKKGMVFVAVAATMIGFGAIGCSDAAENVEGGETIARTREALTQTFELPIPIGFNPQDIVIGATGVVNVNDAAFIDTVAPQALSSFWGNIAAFGPTSSWTNIGKSTQVGVVWSRPSLLLRGGTLEFYKALGTVSPQAGTLYRQPQENSQAVNIRQDRVWTVSITAPDTGLPRNVNAGDLVVLPSGNYGDVTVNSNGTLRLSGSADYGFRSLTINTGSTVQLTASVAPRIFVRFGLTIRSALDKPGLILGYLGTSTAHVEGGGFRGDLFIAPNADIEIKAISIGHFFGKNVTVFEQVNVRGPALSPASQAYIRPSSSTQRRGLLSLSGAAEIGSALLLTEAGCTEPTVFVGHHGASLFHRAVSTIGTTTPAVQAAFPAPTPAPASCIGTALPGHDHNPADGLDPDPPLWPIQPGGRPFHSDVGVLTDNVTTRLSGGRIVHVGFSIRYCEDPNNGLPQGANCPGAAPMPGAACNAVTNPAACLYGPTHCLCAPGCFTAPAPCTTNAQCCSGTCSSGGTCTTPTSAPGTWACGPLNRAEVGTLGVRMTTNCGSSWTAGAFDPYALGIPVGGGGTARVVDRQEIYFDPFDARLYVSTNTFAGGGVVNGAQQVIYSASTSGVTNASNFVWQPVRPPEPRDSAPKVMTTVVDERARLNTTPVTFGRYVHLVTARCVGLRPFIDIETPYGRKQWDIAEGDTDPSTACDFVSQGSIGQPFPGIQFGPSIVGVSSTPPRVLVAYTGISNTTPPYTIINVYSATIRSANGYATRPVIRREHRVDVSLQGAHSVWPQLIAPDGLGNSSALFDMPVVLRWSSIAPPNVTENAQVLYSGLVGPLHNIVFWSIPNTFPGVDCPNAGLGCFVGDYKYGAFYLKNGVSGALSYFTPWTGGNQTSDPPIGYSTASGAFVDVVP